MLNNKKDEIDMNVLFSKKIVDGILNTFDRSSKERIEIDGFKCSIDNINDFIEFHS